MKLPLSVEAYEEIFVIDDSAFEDSIEERIEKLRDKQTSKYRKKTIRSGPILEVEIYPLYGSRGGKRGKKNNGSRKVQVDLNDKNAVKHLNRLLNINFTEEDLWATLTYSDLRLPADPERAKKDMTNYIRRLKRYMKRHNLPELKYVYVTEYEDDEEKGKKRVHHHIIMNFRDRDVAEALWNDGGDRTQTRKLEPNNSGLEALARYMSKDKKNNGTKRYTPSRNLKQPMITIADSKVTRRRVEKLATEEISAQDYFEKIYKGYQFNDMEVKYSDFVNGAYLYVRMKRIDSPVKQKRRKNE